MFQYAIDLVNVVWLWFEDYIFVEVFMNVLIFCLILIDKWKWLNNWKRWKQLKVQCYFKKQIQFVGQILLLLFYYICIFSSYSTFILLFVWFCVLWRCLPNCVIGFNAFFLYSIKYRYSRNEFKENSLTEHKRKRTQAHTYTQMKKNVIAKYRT